MISVHASLGRLAIVLVRLMALSAVLPILVSCDSLMERSRLRASPPTAHERYAESLRDAGLENTALGGEWLTASDSALRAPFVLALPAREIAVYSRSEARAVAYQVTLREGERLRVAVRVDGVPLSRLYLDLYEVVEDTTRLFRHRASADSMLGAARGDSALTLAYEAERTGSYILRLQPELLRSGRFEVTARTEPTLAFPVAGRDNAAIQSLFGAVRDGGRRDHHGIDIFAPRGTPVVAAASGIVRSVAPNRLGGNVVWLADQRRRQSLYYAHLDRHAVVAGQSVQVGDTIGFVGNTGNARTTAPHLHFGIYRRGHGPVDPLVHVRRQTARAPDITADASSLGARAVVRGVEVGVQSGTGTQGVTVRLLSRGTSVRIMGAAASRYRIQLDDGTAGYLNATALRVVGTPPRDFGSD